MMLFMSHASLFTMGSLLGNKTQHFYLSGYSKFSFMWFLDFQCCYSSDATTHTTASRLMLEGLSNRDPYLKSIVEAVKSRFTNSTLKEFEARLYTPILLLT